MPDQLVFKKTSAAILLIALMSAGLAAACSSTVPTPKYASQPVPECQYSVKSGGLVLSVDPLTSSQECKKHFGKDLLAQGILPVFVSLENRNPSSSFIVKNDQFSIASVNAGGVDRSRVSDESGLVTLNNVLMGSAIVASMINRELNVQQNFTSKEFRSETLSPGDRAHGFVYFQIPPGGLDREALCMHAKVLDSTTREWKSLTIKFSLGRSGT